MNSTSDVIVIGGGVIGLSIAWRLAQMGRSVSLFERNLPRREASLAAAGMLAPLAEVSFSNPLAQFGLASLAMYSGFVDELKQCTEHDPELSIGGTLQVAATDEQSEALLLSYVERRKAGIQAEWIEEPRSIERALSSEIKCGLHSPTERSVNALKLGATLEEAAKAEKVRFYFYTPVTELRHHRGIVTIRNGSSTHEAPEVVIAAGAWSAEVSALFDFQLPVFPVKGQMLSLMSREERVFRHTIYGHGAYLVQRQFGDIIVGATEEHAGFDKKITASGIHSLLGNAMALSPAMAKLPVFEMWTGLRPGTPDKLPIVGKVPGYDNVFVATGHYRNGILLTPITAQVVTELMTGKTPSVPIAAFDPGRFQGT